jgi:hypothetical protein
MAETCQRDSAVALDLSRQLVRSLQNPRAYREKTNAVVLIETHISWVFLTDHFAYKLKKPVRFGFLDFSTDELRRQACENEVKLNRRLAPGVYLGVIPVVKTARDGIAIGREGTPVDWVVQMRRLPADASLDVLMRDGRVLAPAIEQLAKTLSTFYENLPPIMVTVDGFRKSIERHVAANREELTAGTHHLDKTEIQRVHEAQLRVLKLAPDLLDDRVRNGRVVEGHGDLRPEHIYFTPSPVIIDCIEFNQEFRTLDVADELAFLSMECDFLGAADITAPIFERYGEQSGDHPARQLIDFYRIYRACVRAKVCALRAEQLRGEARTRWLVSAKQYLDLASRYTHTLGPPMLIMVCGLPGTGKSTIAQTISKELDLELIQTDALRKEVFGTTADRSGFDEGRYRPENRQRIYEQMHSQADELLKNGQSVILDGTYLAASSRTDAARLAEQNHAEFLSVHCQCPEEIAMQRIEARAQEGNADSQTRPEFFDRQRQAEEDDTQASSVLCVDTSSGIVEPMREIFKSLREILID